LRAICNISSYDGEDLFADKLLVYWEWKTGYEVKEQANKKQERMLSMVNLSPKHKIPTLVCSPFTFFLSENVFYQGMVVLLNPVCVLLSGMFHVYKSKVRAAVFETW